MYVCYHYVVNKDEYTPACDRRTDRRTAILRHPMYIIARYKWRGNCPGDLCGGICPGNVSRGKCMAPNGVSLALIICLRPHSMPAANLAANLVFALQPGQVFDKFVRVCNTLLTSFLLFLSKTWSRTAAGSLVPVLDKWNVEKNRFKQVRSWLSTCLRPGLRPDLQLARIMECGL